MKRIGTILDDLASATDSELGRLLAEARASTRERTAGAARGETARRPMADEGGVNISQSELGKSAGGTKPPASFQGEKRQGPERHMGGPFLRVVVDNSRDRCARQNRRSRVHPSLRLVVGH